MIDWDEVKEIDSNKIHGNSFFHHTLDFVLLPFRQISLRAPGQGAVPSTGELVVMLPGPLGHQVGVVGGSGVGYGPGAPAVEMTEVVRQHLRLIICELAVIPKNLQDIVITSTDRD